MTTTTGSESLSPKNLQQWLSQGELLYTAIMKECQAIEAQIAELESRLSARQADVNQIATVIGKPPIETNRRLSAQLVSPYPPEQGPRPTSQFPRSLPPSSRPSREPVAREVIPPRT